MIDEDDALEASVADFLKAFGEKTELAAFVKGFKSVYNSRNASDIMGFAIDIFSSRALYCIGTAKKESSELEKAKLLGEGYGWSLLLINYGIASPRFWQELGLSDQESKSKICQEVLSDFKEISGILKEMGKGISPEFLRKKIESIAKEKGRELPQEAKTLLAQIAALVKK